MAAFENGYLYRLTLCHLLTFGKKNLHVDFDDFFPVLRYELSFLKHIQTYICSSIYLRHLFGIFLPFWPKGSSLKFQFFPKYPAMDIRKQSLLEENNSIIALCNINAI